MGINCKQICALFHDGLESRNTSWQDLMVKTSTIPAKEPAYQWFTSKDDGLFIAAGTGLDYTAQAFVSTDTKHLLPIQATAAVITTLLAQEHPSRIDSAPLLQKVLNVCQNEIARKGILWPDNADCYLPCIMARDKYTFKNLNHIMDYVCESVARTVHEFGVYIQQAEKELSFLDSDFYTAPMAELLH